MHFNDFGLCGDFEHPFLSLKEIDSEKNRNYVVFQAYHKMLISVFIYIDSLIEKNVS